MKYYIRIGLLVFVTSCGQISSWLATSDSQNKTILSDVAFSSASVGRGASSASGSGEVTQCRKHPMEVCRADGQTYCAAYQPPEPGEVPTEDLGEVSFEERHQKMHSYMECLKTNVASLSTECQAAVQNAPQHPPKKGPGFQPGQGKGGPRPPHPPGACGGKSLIGACVSDARTLCAAELPAQGEVDPLTRDGRRDRVESILTCLANQMSNVSAECQAALQKVPVN